MAIKVFALHFFWILNCLIQYAESTCLVSCTTNFMDSLNCSWSGMDRSPYSMILEVECRDFEGQVNGSCEIASPQGWCLIEPNDFDQYVSIGTTCSTTIKNTEKPNQMLGCTNESVNWNLSEKVKPQHPSKVHVTETKENYNLTWEINDHLDNKFMYRVRIRTKALKDPQYYLTKEDQKYIFINYKTLQQHTDFMVDVQAKVGPQSRYGGPWSEWSSIAELNEHSLARENTLMKKDDMLWWCLFPPVVFVLCLGLVYFIKPSCLTKKYFVKHIPKPDEFFKPLYDIYAGDFQKWVRPIFSESDHLMMNPPVLEIPVKQLEVIMLPCESMGDSSSENNQKDSNHGIISLLGLTPHSSSLFYFGGGSGQSTILSTDHISIHTVTISGGEKYASGGSREGMDSKLENAMDCRMDTEGRSSVENGRSSTCPPAIEWQPQAHNLEPELISLDSFCSNEPSEDGYPRVDLDTFDSGFMESDCSSPVNSDFDAEEQINPALLSAAESSNYVKQWMISSTMEGYRDNSRQHSAGTPKLPLN